MEPEGIVISPGPCDPDKAGICLDLIREAAGRVPILGVCLGHQAIRQTFARKVLRAPRPLHVQLSRIDPTAIRSDELRSAYVFVCTCHLRCFPSHYLITFSSISFL